MNVISTTRAGITMATHVGLVVLGPNGERHFLHSSEPVVREETLDAYIAQCKAHYWGVSRDTQFLHWLIDREYQQCRSAA